MIPIIRLEVNRSASGSGGVVTYSLSWPQQNKLIWFILKLYYLNNVYQALIRLTEFTSFFESFRRLDREPRVAANL